MILRQRTLVAVALVLSGAYFFVRGPWRALRGHDCSIDFQDYMYIGLRTFALGGDPYRPADVIATAAAIPGRDYWVLLNFYKGAIIYAPPFFVLAPIGLLPLRLAVWIWFLLQCAAYAALIVSVQRLFPRVWATLDKALLLACALSLAPAHTNLAVGNTAMIFAALTAALFLCLERNSVRWGGVVLGLLMMKPTFGIPAGLLAVVWNRWRLLSWGVLVSALLSAPLFLRWGLAGTLSEWRQNIAVQSAPGMPADDSFLNPTRYQLLNLRSWLYDVVGRGWAEILTGAVIAALLYTLYRFRRQAHETPALYWTLACTLLLLATYHRFYDATLLLVPVAGAFDLYRRKSRWTWVWVTALIPFAVPGAPALQVALGKKVNQIPLAESVLVRHETLAILMLAVASIAAMAERAQPAPGRPGNGRLVWRVRDACGLTFWACPAVEEETLNPEIQAAEMIHGEQPALATALGRFDRSESACGFPLSAG